MRMVDKVAKKVDKDDGERNAEISCGSGDHLVWISQPSRRDLAEMLQKPPPKVDKEGG